MGFKKIKEKNYTDIQMKVSVYEHIQTGARHIHTDYNTTQNSFNVAFTTLPKDNTGVAHILEHSVLNGSEKFPMHGVFFAMQGRNFETFANAMTGFDTTQYPFSTIDEQGFFNLLSVYLDATFFPKLEKEIFLQEGWRYELAQSNETQEELTYSGVVFNEMKGAYANPERVSYVEMLRQAFANTQYEHFSGGNPVDIPKLSYEQFIAFHKKHYHPSNATFYSFGSISAQCIQEKLEQWVLNRFEKTQALEVDISCLNINGQTYHATHPATEGVLYYKGYKLPSFSSVQDLFELEIIQALMHSGKNSFHDFFMENTTSASVNSIGLLPMKACVFYLAFQKDTNDIKEVNTYITQYFTHLVENGVDEEDLDNIFDMIELQIREGEAVNDNIGMQTISRFLSAQRYGFENIEDMANMSLLHDIRAKFKQPEYFKNKIKTLFLENMHFFDFISSADAQYAQKMETALSAQLNLVKKTLTTKDKQAIIKQNQNLDKLRQAKKDDTLLPTLKLRDIQIKHPEYVEYKKENINGYDLYQFDAATHGVSYVEMRYPLIIKNQQDLFKTAMVIELLPNINLQGMSLAQTTFWKETKVGDLDCGFSTITTETGFEPFIYVKAKALEENSTALMQKTLAYIQNMAFDNEELIKNNLLASWRDYISSYQEEAFSHIILEAQAKLSNAIEFRRLLNNDYKAIFLKEVITQIEAGDMSFIHDLKITYQTMFQSAAKVFVASSKQGFEKITQVLSQGQKKSMLMTQYSLTAAQSPLKEVIDFNNAINHVAYCMHIEGLSLEQEGQIQVLASYLQPYLHTHIREKGGAYGARASYSDNGIFTLFSFRDPNSIKTLDVFKAIPEYMKNHLVDEAKLEVTKLNLLKAFNKPQEDIVRVGRTVNKILGQKDKNPKLLAQAIANTTASDMMNLMTHYIEKAIPSVVIATNEKFINENFLSWYQKK